MRYLWNFICKWLNVQASRTRTINCKPRLLHLQCYKVNKGGYGFVLDIGLIPLRFSPLGLCRNIFFRLICLILSIEEQLSTSDRILFLYLKCHQRVIKKGHTNVPVYSLHWFSSKYCHLHSLLVLCFWCSEHRKLVISAWRGNRKFYPIMFQFYFSIGIKIPNIIPTFGTGFIVPHSALHFQIPLTVGSLYSRMFHLEHLIAVVAIITIITVINTWTKTTMLTYRSTL